VSTTYTLTIVPSGIVVDAGATITDTAVRVGDYRLVKQGGGTLILDQLNSHSGGSVIEAGTVVVRNASALGTGEVRVKAGATLVIDPAAGEVAAGSLVIEEGGFVDLGGGRMLIRTGGSAESIMALILAGQGDGSWSAATGLGSSGAAEANAAGQQRRIGWLDNGDGSFTVAFAAPGDTNLDGSIDILDVANFFTGGKYDAVVTTAWTEGDFNYDAQADILDIADFFGTSLFDAGPYLASAANPAAASLAADSRDTTAASGASAFESALVALAAELDQAATVKKKAFARLR
jgi:autotransporter-associated beta strand protein